MLGYFLFGVITTLTIIYTIGCIYLSEKEFRKKHVNKRSRRAPEDEHRNYYEDEE